MLALWVATGLAAFFVAAQGVVGADYRCSSLSVTGTPVVVSTSPESTVKATVVCFLGVECPMARIYATRLTQLAEEFAGDVRVVGMDSNRQDSDSDILRFVQELKLTWPVVRDTNNVFADNYGATRTPEVFVLNAELKLVYHGRIDDQYSPGISRAKPEREDLREALRDLLAGQPVRVAETNSPGCLIGRVASGQSRKVVENDVTYYSHVERVLQQHCLECHRSGEIGPFAMNDYAEVVGWAETMIEVVDNGRMPPWHANPQHGQFQNARQMPESDKQFLRDWLAGGLKEGDSADRPAPVKFTEGWQLPGQPDLVVAMRNRPFTVPAQGMVEYQYFVVDPGFTEDKWISAAEVIPGVRSVVHHAIVFVRPPDGADFRGVGWMAAYVPGQRGIPLPSGYARHVPAGSKLVFQMHYTPNGVTCQDTTQIGLMFADEKEVTHELFTLIALNQEFEIPPQAERHLVTARVPDLPEEGILLAATPHMHYRGRSFRLLGNGDADKPLLDVPRYDFNWQHSYAFAEAIPLAHLNELSIEVTFDNSLGNPFNPDPAQWVTWGDQTWEEMAVAFFEVAEPRHRHELPAPTAVNAAEEPTQNTSLAKAAAWVTAALSKMDTDADGEISESEAPIVVRKFGRGSRYDRDGNGVITKVELHELAKELFK